MSKKKSSKRKSEDGLSALAAKWEHLSKCWKITAQSLEQDGVPRLAGHYTGAAYTALMCAQELRTALAA